MLTEIATLAKGSGSLSERVRDSLRQSILTLVLAPGERINKKVIADQLGVSLFPVSEAITHLAAEGIVEVFPQAGTYVSPFSMREIHEGLFLREALETAAVEYIAKTATDEQITELKRNFRIQEVLAHEEDSDGFFKMDREMHEIILKATGFPKLLSLTKTVWLQAERARHLFAKTPGSAIEALEEHRIVIDAITAHDPEKARLGMKSHLSRVACELEQLEHTRSDLFEPSKAKNKRSSAAFRSQLGE